MCMYMCMYMHICIYCFRKRGHLGVSVCSQGV